MRKCLVVEDEPDHADLTRRVLALAGHQVRVAGTGARAMRRFWAGVDCNCPYEVIVLDCALPKLSGWSVAALIRRAESQMPTLRPVRLVGYTGYGAQAETFISDSDFTLFDRVLFKPARPEEITEAVGG